ncbi:UPF0158 family protein [Pseudomonas sp. RIT-PI-AD]|uniref:UPF0158 family protein n=1 Tax=Pseudomonas sp. RIT-PI-AD TaxID=3035294 RepID=UPI0021DA75DD|nr:UPF0158 family protein [Pseudomonas sp. RIT-PI-AD]
MRTLTLDMNRLEALLDDPGQAEHYLDLDSGALLSLEADADDQQAAQALAEAPQRYCPLEGLGEADRLAMGEAFLYELDDPHAHPILAAALAGRRPLRTFDYELERLPRIRQAWRDYRRGALHEWALAWLEERGIEPAREPAAADALMPEGIRRRLYKS